MVLRNCSRRLARANFSKLGWQPNVIWTIAFSLCLKFYAIAARKPDLIRGSLNVHTAQLDRIHIEICYLRFDPDLTRYGAPQKESEKNRWQPNTASMQQQRHQAIPGCVSPYLG
jgi:hypothetical protein